MKKTIAGDIRRIRKDILKPNGDGLVVAEYGKLHKAFNEIEAKERELSSMIRELADNISLLSMEVCAGCPQRNCFCGEQKCSLMKNANRLVAMANGVQ